MSNIVITGSTKGIGFGLAQEFAAQNHNVVITGRSQQSINHALARISRLPGRVVGIPCDVADKSQVQALWDFATDNMNSVDIWINNAGLACTTKSIIDYSETDVKSMVSTNMLGTIHGCQVAGSGMKIQGGKIFNMLGGGSDGQYFAGMGIYGTTKRGLHYLTNAMVKEFKNTPVVIGGIRPGIIITEAVIREAREDIESFQKSRKIMNILADKVTTVTPFLVDNILKFKQSGKEICWLTGGKISRRMMLSRFSKQEDKFTEYGL
ncbi:MAG: NAD(P)-dependent dehydrogenase (short-subunit alcohol dehydrogenase family) [Oceanicoccus sp.]|jgi:NAD(P)-dependent dehydrogenase (short-subunit alcohol dehydrogenase family)